MRPMKLAIFALLSLCLGACGVVERLLTVTIGPPELPPLELPMTMPLLGLPLDTCPAESTTFVGGEVSMAQAEGGCQVTLLQPELQLIDEAAAADAAAQLDGASLQAIERATLTLEEIAFLGPEGQALTLGQEILAVKLAVDGITLMETADIQALVNGPVERDLTGPLLDRILGALENPAAVSISAEISLTLSDALAAQGPERVDIPMTLQPRVTVNVLQALEGAQASAPEAQ